MGEAEAELLNLVSHEEATPEGCLAGLQAALAVPCGVPLARYRWDGRKDLLLSSLARRHDRRWGWASALCRQSEEHSSGCLLELHLASCATGTQLSDFPGPHCAPSAFPSLPPACRSALSLVMERFSEEPGLAVELVRAALRIATSGSGISTGRAEGSGAGADGGGTAAGSQPEAHQPGAAPAQAAAAAEALVLELVADDRLLERVCEEGLRRELLGLLWNHAVAALHAGAAFDSALAFFSAALPLLEAGSSGMQIDGCEGSPAEAAGGPQAVECRRAQALCCLGARQFDRWGGVGQGSMGWSRTCMICIKTG